MAPPRFGFFPAIVSQDLWGKAHTSVSARRAVNERGQVISKFGGQRGGIHDLFAGLVIDGNMGLPALAGKRQALPPEAGYRFEILEWSHPEHHCLRRFQSRLPDLARSTGLVDRHRCRRFGGDPAVRGTNELKASIEADWKIETIIDALIRLPSPALKARLRTTETAVASHMSELSITDTKLTEAKKKHRDLLNDNIVYRTFSKAKSLEMRARFRAEIARKVARIRFWFYRDENTPKLVPDSKHDLFPFAQIIFHEWPGAICRVVQ